VFIIIFQYIYDKMQRYTLYLYLETALHVSGGTSTHHQKRIQLYLQNLIFVTPLLVSAVKRLRFSRSSVLAFGTLVCGFAPGRSRLIFRAKKSSARFPSEGK
jgi:hypothetical protein